MAVDVRPYGPDAVLIDTTPGLVLAVAGAVRAACPDAETEVVPTASSVMVWADGVGRDRRRWQRLEQVAREAARVDAQEMAEGSVIDVPVVYDGADLDEIAHLVGATVSEVVAWHQADRFRVAFCGFAPGFAYLVGGDRRLRLPRRATPRTSVPAGSVALGGGYCGVYPRSSPGGWHLVGRTTITLWDADRRPPALLTPGAVVRFVSVGS